MLGSSALLLRAKKRTQSSRTGKDRVGTNDCGESEEATVRNHETVNPVIGLLDACVGIVHVFDVQIMSMLPPELEAQSNAIFELEVGG